MLLRSESTNNDEEEDPSSSFMRSVAAQLHRSLLEKGVVLLVNHGIVEQKLHAVYAAMDAFCALPTDVRDKYLRTPPSNHGYVPPGLEKFSSKHLQEMRHSFNVVSLDHKLPEKEVPDFQTVVAALAQDFQNLATLLLRALALGLELPVDFFLASHRLMLQPGNESCLRLLLYPPFDKPPPPRTTRCGEHTDYGTFSLLAQDSEGGLEIQLDSHVWGRVGYLPGAILVNTGEILAAWTSSKYPALNHRVIVPEQHLIRSRGRHSFAFFVHPDDDTPIEPIQSAVLAEHQTSERRRPTPVNDKVYTAYQHVQMRFQQTYASSV